MSAEDENRVPETDDVRVIPIKGEMAASHEAEDDSPKIAPSPELEQALQEALASVEHKDSKKGRSAAYEMAQEERENFQTRIRNLHVQLLEKTKELDEIKDRLLRSQADSENFKKRAQKERADQYNYGNEEIARAFLEVFDNLERALKHADSSAPSSLIDGVKLTVRHMEQIFDRFGIVPIKALGEKFDPAYHQAMAQVYKDDVQPGMVVEEHQRGFMIKDRLLRPSMVVISTNRATEEVKSGAKE
jgi:molecular chaperone GrpE